MLRLPAALAGLVALALLVPAGAQAAGEGGSGPQRAVDETQAEKIASRVPKLAEIHRENPDSYFSAIRKPGQRWEVSLWDPGESSKQVGLAIIDARSGKVIEAWTGFQVAWSMARGYPGAFGRSVNSPWVWVTLSVLFFLPFFDWRKPLRWLHFDLLVLLGFGLSLAFFNDANLGISVPISGLLLAVLLARLLAIGLRRSGREPPPLRLLFPWQALLFIGLFLLGFRAALNMVDGNVIDVGYAGVIGADKLLHGNALYGAFPKDNGAGDTYGPLLYLAYAPFELIWPWQGRWDDLPAAHAAAGVFDVACVAALFLIGRRLRDNALGVILAYAWLAFPFTVYVTNSGSNDALPAALVLFALALHARPMARGALTMAAGMSKFAPLALVPLMATHGMRDGWLRRSTRWKRFGLFALGALLVLGLAAALVFPTTSAETFWERTVGYQVGREAPFSVWGFYGGGWEVAQKVVQAATLVGAVAVAFVPRRDDLIGLAALAGAVLVAVELSATYWFYLYIVWFLGPALVAFLARPALSGLPVRRPRAEAPARSSPPAAAAGT